MKVIPPVNIDDTTLSACSAVEPLDTSFAAAYSGATTYSIGDIVSSGGLVYVSLKTANLNNDPSTSPVYWAPTGNVIETAWNSGTAYAGGEIIFYKHRVYVSILAGTNKNPYTSADYWSDVGPTNKYAMFDTERDTATLATSPLTFTIQPGQRCDTIGFLDVTADSIQVQVSIPGVGIAYDVTNLMFERTGIINGFTYFYTPFTSQKTLVLFDLPTDSGASIIVTVLRSSGKISLGAVVVGTANELGAAQHDGLVDGMLNFSNISNDDLGNSVLIKRRSVSTPAITVWAPDYLTDAIISLRDQLNAVPALWCGIEDDDNYFFRALCVLGVYTQFDIGLPYADTSVLTLKLKEI